MPEAVPDVKAASRPLPPLFNLEEWRATPRSARVKILKSWAGVRAYCGIMEGKMDIWQEWGEKVFSGQKPSEMLEAKPEPKKGWWPFRK